MSRQRQAAMGDERIIFPSSYAITHAPQVAIDYTSSKTTKDCVMHMEKSWTSLGDHLYGPEIHTKLKQTERELYWSADELVHMKIATQIAKWPQAALA